MLGICPCLMPLKSISNVENEVVFLNLLFLENVVYHQVILYMNFAGLDDTSFFSAQVEPAFFSYQT
jgi:hypothetical protein